MPALVLDDGTIITESIAICRYFEALQPEPPLFGRGALEQALVEMWNRRCDLNFLCRVAQVFRHLHPGDEDDGSAAGARTGARPTGRASLEFLKILDGQLAGHPFVAGDEFLGRRHHRYGRGRFHEAGQDRGAGELVNVARWHAEVSARPSAKA